jgi:hypothetical protein
MKSIVKFGGFPAIMGALRPIRFERSADIKGLS